MTTPTPAPGRLRNGELRRQVAGFLADHAGSEYTPGEVARGLPDGPRSSGAAGNPLALLADQGKAEQASTKPLRYQATATTTAAALALRPVQPAPHAHPYDGGTIHHQHHHIRPARVIRPIRFGYNGGSGGGVRSGDPA